MQIFVRFHNLFGVCSIFKVVENSCCFAPRCFSGGFSSLLVVVFSVFVASTAFYFAVFSPCFALAYKINTIKHINRLKNDFLACFRAQYGRRNCVEICVKICILLHSIIHHNTIHHKSRF